MSTRLSAGERPSKEAVRAWLAERRVHAAAPPSPAEIRAQLNWRADTPPPIEPPINPDHLDL